MADAPVIHCTHCNCTNLIPPNPKVTTQITCQDCGKVFYLREAHQIENRRADEAAKSSGS